MRTVAIVQARMGSTRLPGKSAMLLRGKPMVWHVLNRVKQACRSVALAIPVEPNSGPLVEAADSLDIPVIVVGGNPNDLVHRYSVAARALAADTVIRVPADNPCVDPDEIKRIIAFHRADPPYWKYLTTNLDRVLGNGYPGGLGAEVYDARLLRWLENEITDTRYREHPHLWAFENARVITCKCPEEIRRPDLRFDVNTQEDFDFISDIYDALYPMNPNFRAADVIRYCERSNHGNNPSPDLASERGDSLQQHGP